MRAYRLHLIERWLKAGSINPIGGALRFFYGATLGGKEIAQQIPFARKEDTPPAVLSREQAMQLLRTEPACRACPGKTGKFAGLAPQTTREQRGLRLVRSVGAN